jgi:hypothetical protein
VGPPRKKSKLRGIGERQRITGAKFEETRVSGKKPGKLSYHMEFLMSSKTTPETVLKLWTSPVMGRGLPGTMWGEGSDG